MFGIPTWDEVIAKVFCDNESVVRKVSRVEYTLKNKHNVIAYNYFWWEVAATVDSVDWILTKDNFTDALKRLLRNPVRD